MPTVIVSQMTTIPLRRGILRTPALNRLADHFGPMNYGSVRTAACHCDRSRPTDHHSLYDRLATI